MPDKSFIDSNVLLYLLLTDEKKANKAEALLDGDVTISVQVLNEITNVARKKYNMAWASIADFLDTIRSICTVVPMTAETHDRARHIAERYQLSFYDACVVASALNAGARVLYSEDMHAGTTIEKSLRIVNPFK
jgi:predicted nucleic acid-binding protein